MAKDTETYAHQEWLGYVQPVGLVVSIPALLSAQVYINKNIVPEHQRFLSCLPRDRYDEVIPEIRDFSEFTQTVLCWETEDLLGRSDGEPIPSSLEVALPEYHETLRPTYAVREFKPKDSENPWLMLIQELPTGTDLDKAVAEDSRHWHADPQSKFERLLRETQIPIGLLFNGTHLRLVYAPRGETSGYMTFVVDEMAKVAGRPIFAALHTLLSAERLFSLEEKQRLPKILADSRKYQNVVSNKLAEQVLAALYELLRGFQAADDQRRGELLRDVLAEDPNHVYAGLLTVLMRLVFVLYAEDRDLLSSDPVYANYYSVTGLFERLRADAGRFPDTMDQRYGAWAQLLTLFRLIYEGGSHGEFHIPARKGYLFDPDRFNFLEGRQWKTSRGGTDSVDIPRVSDGVIFRVLNNLLILDGERLSYRALDVEQIGSVYETMMGFDLQVAQGRSTAIKPTKSHGAPPTINLEELLDVKAKDRAKWLRDQTEQTLTGPAATSLSTAETIDDLLAALEKKIARRVTPNVVPKGAMVLQPSEERRRSGSHYTPRSLTEPIVRTTLRPIFDGLGEHPTPEQILDLKVCDPAMGSGAFLVEACRQIGDELVKAWYCHDCIPQLPPDEDELLYARRLTAQRCLYGVDKNPIAVDLAKLSLWLITLAKDHSFTFIDHALKHGDSLVGLARDQIEVFHWQSQVRDPGPIFQGVTESINKATSWRNALQNLDEEDYPQQKHAHQEAESALHDTRITGDLVITAFFSADKEKERETLRRELRNKVDVWRNGNQGGDALQSSVDNLHHREKPVLPFHWEVDFPEVFGRENPGFDAIVGNPPFLTGGKITSVLGTHYLSWLKALHEDIDGNSDLVAYFFRRAFGLLRLFGCAGLVATNTVAQGDTRRAGLAYILGHDGTIYCATRRLAWPGLAAVVVSVVHFYRSRNTTQIPSILNGRVVDRISAFLFRGTNDKDPVRLVSNHQKSFGGAKIYGQGFVLTPEEAEQLNLGNPANKERIFPYIGGQEINTNPCQTFERYVINFGTMSLEEASRWPDLLQIVREKVKPERDKRTNNAIALRQKKYWWRYRSDTPLLRAAIKDLSRCIANSQVSTHHAMAFQSTEQVFSHAVNVFAFDTWSAFTILQSRIHESWARFFGSSMKDDLRYTPSDCFETFPFPKNWQTHLTLEAAGMAYYEFRADVMVRNDEGLTKTYNRFHNSDERSLDILRLREMHADMDRAVLDAYGWQDLTPTCEFLLDYEEENVEDETDSTHSSRKKPWRYRWPDEFRDEILGWLLALNQEQAEQERLSGVAAESASTKSAKRDKSGRSSRKTTGKRNRKQQNEPEPLDLFSNIETAEKSAKG